MCKTTDLVKIGAWLRKPAAGELTADYCLSSGHLYSPCCMSIQETIRILPLAECILMSLHPVGAAICLMCSSLWPAARPHSPVLNPDCCMHSFATYLQHLLHPIKERFQEPIVHRAKASFYCTTVGDLSALVTDHLEMPSAMAACKPKQGMRAGH